MADDVAPPVSTTVPETVTIDTRAAPEDVKALKDSFQDFWKEQDAEASQETKAPDAPGPAQETKTSEPETKATEPETKPPPAETKPSEPESTDEDIDALQVIPNQRPEVYEQFKNVKDKWKADRAALRAEKERAKAVQAQLAQAQANQLTPELQADYEHAVGVRRRFDFATDPEFIQKFHTPVYQKYQEILEDAVMMLPDPQAARQWADYMKGHHKPEELDRNWWMNSVIAKLPNELDRTQLMGEIAELQKLQKDRSAEMQRRTGDKSSFDAWVNERTQETAQRVQSAIMEEIGVQEKRIADYLPRDLAAAKTKEERAAIEAHNERFTKLNQFFVEQVRDLSSNGPKAWVRVAIEATRSHIMNEQITNLEKELRDAQAERDQLKSELGKISGARRKISQTTGTPPASSTPNGQGLSIKSLDVRDSFKRFNWGDGSNT